MWSFLENEQPEKRPKTVEKSKNKGKPKAKVSKTKGRRTQAMNIEESESTSLSEEVSGNKNKYIFFITCNNFVCLCKDKLTQMFKKLFFI